MVFFLYYSRHNMPADDDEDSGCGYKILECLESDSVALVAHCNAVGGETDNLTFGDGQFHLTAQDEVQFIRGLKENGNGLLMCAKLEGSGSVIAVGSCLSKGRRSAHVYEFGISVRIGHWGKGVGTSLMSRIIAESRMRFGAEKISLAVLASNSRARTMYERFGFVTEGRLSRGFKFPDGRYEDEIVMGYVFPESDQEIVDT